MSGIAGIYQFDGRPADLRREQLHRPVAIHALDPGYGAEIAAPGNVASLGDIDGPVAAEHRAPRRATRMREARHRAPVPSQQLADVTVAEDDGTVRHDDRPLREAEIRGEQCAFHRESFPEA